MADSIRMIDVAGLSRGLDEFRQIDPEHRALAERLASRAAARHRDEVQGDVASADGPAEARVDEHHDQSQRHNGRGERRDPQEADSPKDTSPERDEGLLLDIKV